MIVTSAGPPVDLNGDHLNLIATTTSCVDPGNKVPVLFIHGFTSQPSDFTSYGTPSVESSIAAIPDISVSSFDYHLAASAWVTDPRIGPALASNISCLAKRSANAGGPGKVIVVAHSMGALALRFAAAQTVDGSPVAADLALAVTVGAPNTGSWILGALDSPATRFVAGQIKGLAAWACHTRNQDPKFLQGLIETCGLLLSPESPGGQAMIPGSPPLAALPPLPSTVPLFAVAGNIAATTHFPGHTVTLAPIGDLLVKPDSALAEADHPGPLSGQFTDTCSSFDLTQNLSKFGWTGCEHGGLLYDQPVISKVTDEIHRYQASRQSSVPSEKVPTLGKVWAPNQQGYGQVRPSTIFNGGDPTGLVQNVTWRSWGDSQAMGSGTGYYLPPGAAGVPNGYDAPANVVAFDLGTCEGKYMYRQVEWYFPSKGESFDPSKGGDICTGNYAGSVPSPSPSTTSPSNPVNVIGGSLSCDSAHLTKAFNDAQPVSPGSPLSNPVCIVVHNTRYAAVTFSVMNKESGNGVLQVTEVFEPNSDGGIVWVAVGAGNALCSGTQTLPQAVIQGFAAVGANVCQ